VLGGIDWSIPGQTPIRIQDQMIGLIIAANRWERPIYFAITVPTENMAWFTPDELPGNRYYLFGKEGGIRLAKRLNVPLLGQIPIVQSICEGGDEGRPEVVNADSAVSRAFEELAENMIRETKRRNVELPPTQVVEIKKM